MPSTHSIIDIVSNLLETVCKPPAATVEVVVPASEPAAEQPQQKPEKKLKKKFS